MPKPKDFTESAVKLCNPEPVKVLLEKLSTAQSLVNSLSEELDAKNGPLVKKITKQNETIASLQLEIREAVEEHGSYQDLDGERYAIKYARKTEGYNLEPFKTQFPKFVELCVKETLDVRALKGQIKGKLITEQELIDASVLEYSETYAFYVR